MAEQHQGLERDGCVKAEIIGRGQKSGENYSKRFASTPTCHEPWIPERKSCGLEMSNNTTAMKC